MAAAATASCEPMDRAAIEREMKKKKERFLIFTRVLLKFLEQKDPPLHQKVKGIIKDCADRNKRQERGYESVTASMQARLKEVVN
jgi:predicted alpha/beta-fold hydrolase